MNWSSMRMGNMMRKARPVSSPRTLLSVAEASPAIMPKGIRITQARTTSATSSIR
jgi:hypothetical protein